MPHVMQVAKWFLALNIVNIVNIVITLTLRISRTRKAWVRVSESKCTSPWRILMGSLHAEHQAESVSVGESK